MSESCGTPAGYYRHYRRQEEACDACKEAHARSGAEWSRQTGYGRVKQRARRRLAQIHKEEFKALHDEEMAKEVGPRSPAWGRAEGRALVRLVDAYPDLFGALLSEERKAERDGDTS